MNLKLDLPDELEARIRERVASTGQDVEGFILEAVGEKLAEAAPPGDRPTPREWPERLRALIDMHPRVSHEVDDSRESIYEGRGE